MVGIHFAFYSLWGYVKNRVYAQKINSMQELKDKIKEAFASISLSTLANVFGAFKRRLEDCEKLAGGHIEQCRKEKCADCNRY